ncbi:hypothetical protein BSKO_13420 [Bryopsis sp. KO-2023]|nr:hypothetical protein BSKO_13420 [Bryopsis sp. KO-2023]
MGAKRILQWVVSGGASVSAEVADLIAAQVEQLQQGGEDQLSLGLGEKWTSQCQFMRQAQEDSKSGQQALNSAATGQEVVVVVLSEASKYRYLVARGEKIVVEADETIMDVLAKLELQPIPSSNIKFEGSRYKVGDFIVKVGSVSQNEEFKGVMVEVEYAPIMSIPIADPLLANFCTMLQELTSGISPGRLEQVRVDFNKYSLGPQFTPTHSSVLLAAIAGSFIKAA